MHKELILGYLSDLVGDHLYKNDPHAHEQSRTPKREGKFYIETREMPS